MWASRRCWWASSNRWPTPTLSPTSKPAGSWRESWLKTRSRLLTYSFRSNRVFIHLRFVLFQLEFQSNIFYLISFFISLICVRDPSQWQKSCQSVKLIFVLILGTSDSCVTSGEEAIFEYQDSHDLITLGWVSWLFQVFRNVLQMLILDAFENSASKFNVRNISMLSWLQFSTENKTSSNHCKIPNKLIKPKKKIQNVLTANRMTTL